MAERPKQRELSDVIKGLWDKSKVYVISAAIALGTGALSGLLSGNIGGNNSFESLIKSPLSPPPALFPIVWTVLYTLMGVSSAMVLKADRPEKTRGLILYAIQLGFNFFWSIFFFRLEWRLFAFIWLVALVLLVAAMIYEFWKSSKAAALLQLPYLAWLLFAGYLNLAIYLLNR